MKSKYLKEILITLGIYFIAIIGCSEKASHIKKETTVKEVLSIGGDYNSSEGIYGFNSVYTASVDSAGNIYIVDQHAQKIHSYTKNGKYRWTVGGEGPGPGEFKGISDIIAADGQLYVLDRQKAMMTSYDLKGNKIEEWTFDSGGSGFKEMRKLPDGRFIFPRWDPESNTLIDIYSENFKEKEASLVNSKDIYQTEESNIEKEILQTKLGSAFSMGEGKIAYVPRHYNGKLILFEYTSEGNWIKTGMIDGYKNIDPSITIHRTADGSHERSLLSGYNPEGGFYNIEFHAMSYGLYPYEDNSIIHLSYYSINEDEWQLVVEKFNTEDQTLEGYFGINNLNISSYHPNKLPLWFDQEGYIYFRENSDDVPRLRKFKIDI